MIPTEPIGGIPRPVDLIEQVKKADREDPKLAPHHGPAVRDFIERIEGASSPVATDIERIKHHRFGAYRMHGLRNTNAGWLHDSVTDRRCAGLGGTVSL